MTTDCLKHLPPHELVHSFVDKVLYDLEPLETVEKISILLLTIDYLLKDIYD